MRPVCGVESFVYVSTVKDSIMKLPREDKARVFWSALTSFDLIDSL